MLDQVIYTRCMPHRDLRNKGAIIRSDGFGVFSASHSILDPDKKIDLDSLLRQLPKKNGSKERDTIGLLSSYEYLSVSDAKYALIYEVPRPFLQDARGGTYSNRADNFIKQGLIGTLKGYPCEYFGANCWNAHKKGENEYYIETDPAWLPQIPAAATGGSITREKVRAFVHDGRTEVVQKAVWFLLEEYSKPIGERKVLLIKDLPANVELWIAAIEYAFSADMAKQITFTTNRTNLGGQTETALFYYTDSTGKYFPNRVGGNALTRTPFCMIVGFHPQDRFCTNVRQQAASNFVLLDGMTKTLNVPADNSIHAPYYSALVQYDADIEDFCSVLLPSLPLKQITNELPALFDAYKYLLDSSNSADKWTYADTVAHLTKLLSFGLPSNDVLNKYMLDECIRAYGRFTEMDERNKYVLLKQMWKIAGVLNREKEVTACVSSLLIDAMQDLSRRGDVACRIWHSLESSGISQKFYPSLWAVFHDSELQRCASQFSACRAEVTRDIVDIYLSALSNGAGGLDSIMAKGERFEFVRDAMVNLVGSRRDAANLLRKLSRVNNLVNALALSVAEHLDAQNSRMTEQWWDIILEVSGGNILDLCKRLCSYSKTKIELVEKLLSSNILRSRACSWETQNTFAAAVAKLGKKNDTGRQFYPAWIQVMKISETNSIIHSAKEIGVSPSLAREIFTGLEKAVGLDILDRDNAQQARALEAWSKELNISSYPLSINNLRRDMDRANKPEDAILALRTFSQKHHVLTDDFIDSEFFAEIAQAARKLCSMDLTLALLLAFQFDNDKTAQDFVDEYVKIALDSSRGSGKIKQMVTLTEALLLTPPRQSSGRAAMIAIQDKLEVSLKRHIPEHVNGSDLERIKSADCDEVVRDELLKMASAGGRGSRGGFRDFMGNIGNIGDQIFRRNKK